MAKYIKKKHLKEAVEQLQWYHINPKGELAEGAYNSQNALCKYSHIEAIIKGLPTKKIAEQTEPQTDCLTCRYNSDEWDSPKCDGCSKAHSNYEPQTDCSWK